MRKPKIDGWYARKPFAHFDYPLNFEDASVLVSVPEKIAVHAFLPFIGYTDKKRRFTPNKTPKYTVKKRPIKYCSHRDGYIHSFYAKKLGQAYESYLGDKQWANCVIGYRTGLGTNIHMAKNAFNEIRKRKDCCAIAIDISDFFGSIDHAVLLNSIKCVLDVSRLPEDWFHVFKSMTRHAWVEFDDLREKLKFDLQNPPYPYCTVDEFRDLRQSDPDFIRVNSLPNGIPQGSPISAIFSNVYMIDFDAACYAFVRSKGEYYRRYSDDIFIVCHPKHQLIINDFVESEILKLGSAIKISKEKIEISHFRRDRFGALSCDTPITYLGFTFDGNRTYLRARTLSRYYRRMTYATRQAARTAREKNSSKIFKRKLYSQFTHLGKANFYGYSKKASRIFGEKTPKRQLKRHFQVLHRKLRNRGR